MKKIFFVVLIYWFVGATCAMAKCIEPGKNLLPIPGLSDNCGVWQPEWKDCTQDSDCHLLGDPCASLDEKTVNKECIQEAESVVGCKNATKNCVESCEIIPGTDKCVQPKVKCVENKCSIVK